MERGGEDEAEKKLCLNGGGDSGAAPATTRTRQKTKNVGKASTVEGRGKRSS